MYGENTAYMRVYFQRPERSMYIFSHITLAHMQPRVNLSQPSYGKHVWKRDYLESFASQMSAVDAIVEWLVSAGISAQRISQLANNSILLIV